MNKSKIKFKSIKGIALITLVITIVLLLILSSISLNAIIGENSLLVKTKDVKQLTEKEELREEIERQVNKDYDLDEINNNLKKISGLTYMNKELSDSNKISYLPALVCLNNYLFIIEDNGNVTYKGEKSNGIEIYSFEDEYVFDGTNYLDTGISLYSEENINKNFEMSFNIVNIANDNVNQNTIVSSMDESGSPWPGHNVKVMVESGKQRVKIESNSNTSSTGDVYAPDNITNIKIIRIDNKLYYSFDGNSCKQINNFTGFTDTFDSPITFGAGFDEKNKLRRFFKGTLSNIKIKILDDDVSIEDYNPPEKPLITAYEHKEPYTFNGSSDYINTGLCMFTKDNIDKDFVVSFKIDSILSGYVNQAVLVNVKLEKNPYPGFVYRLYTSGSTIKFESKAGTGDGASNKQSEVQYVKISRINRKMYLSINDSLEKEVYSFVDFNNYYSVPLTIGAALDGNGNPFRFFKGTLSNILVKVQPD